MLKAIAESGLTLSPPKCHLGYQSIVVLGNKVSRLGLSMHHKKLKAIWELEAPKDRKKLETFLGLAMYFSTYIPSPGWPCHSSNAYARQKFPSCGPKSNKNPSNYLS
jgi:hypothetical protein